jgi:hypothetical protein
VLGNHAAWKLVLPPAAVTVDQVTARVVIPLSNKQCREVSCKTVLQAVTRECMGETDCSVVVDCLVTARTLSRAEITVELATAQIRDPVLDLEVEQWQVDFKVVAQSAMTACWVVMECQDKADCSVVAECVAQVMAVMWAATTMGLTTARVPDLEMEPWQVEFVVVA